MDREITPHVWIREVAVEGENPCGWYRLYISVGTRFQYMYASYSGNSHICTWVAMRTIVYVHGFKEGPSCMSVHVLLGKSRFVHADFNNNTSDVRRSYRWSATYM
jgi:hypothetical protein